MLRKPVEDLLGIDLAEAQSVTHEIKSVEKLGIQRVLDAALIATERGEASRPMRLRGGDIQEAVQELVFFGGELTQRLLGSRTGRFGFRPTREAETA
jgi:hypothetical protein